MRSPSKGVETKKLVADFIGELKVGILEFEFIERELALLGCMAKGLKLLQTAP